MCSWTKGSYACSEGGIDTTQSQPKGRFKKWHKALHCEMQNFIISSFFERNAEEHKDRIWVYPSVVLRSYKRQREGDAMQHIV